MAPPVVARICQITEDQVDLAKGIPVDGYLEDVHLIDLNGDSVIRGLNEIERLNEVVKNLRDRASFGTSNLRDTLCSLDGLVPKIEAIEDDPGNYRLILYGKSLVIRNVSPSSPVPSHLDRIGSALQLIPASKWSDLLETTHPTIYFGAYADLYRYFLVENPENLPHFGLPETGIGAKTIRFVDLAHPENTRSLVILPSELDNRPFTEVDAHRYGCAVDEFFVNGLFAVTGHEFGHLSAGALGQKLGLGPSIPYYSGSLPAYLVEESQQTKGECDPSYDTEEYFPEILNRYNLCRHLSQTDSYTVENQTAPRNAVPSLYPYSQPEAHSWMLLMGALRQFYEEPGIDPAPFIECGLDTEASATGEPD